MKHGFKKNERPARAESGLTSSPNEFKWADRGWRCAGFLKHGFKKRDALIDAAPINPLGGAAVQQPVRMSFIDFQPRFPALPHPCFIRVHPWQKKKSPPPRRLPRRAELWKKSSATAPARWAWEIPAAARWAWEIPAVARGFFRPRLSLSPPGGAQHPTSNSGLALFAPRCPACFPSGNKLLQIRRTRAKPSLKSFS
jgi:hypothetical protein